MENSGQATALSVSQLNRQVKALLETGLTRLWVEGEISNLVRPASGHLYFRLKDESAQIAAAFFRNRQRGPTIGFKNGDHVLAYGQVSLYEARGDYQLIVEQIEAAGEGVLKRRYEALKRKLADEGLFDEDRKQAIPELPGRIGVITSPSGAAIRDILTILGRRFPAVPVIVYPSAVQGDAAAPELVGALQTAIRRAECDVIILTRGGGSLEDLWAFNDEQLARAIADAPIPVVSAVGHEIDFTIADFVADVRAPTPSGAAELVVPDREEWLRALAALLARVARQGRRTLEDKGQALDWLNRRLVAGRPAARVQQSIRQLAYLRQRLAAAGRRMVSEPGHALRGAARALDAVSPLATLDRGYAIVTDAASGKALLRARDVKPGNDIRARLAAGELIATIREVIDGDM
jgi:exodeoxyribonuclease VII large subunit